MIQIKNGAESHTRKARTLGGIVRCIEAGSTRGFGFEVSGSRAELESLGAEELSEGEWILLLPSWGYIPVVVR
jgi:hypothetical protein